MKLNTRLIVYLVISLLAIVLLQSSLLLSFKDSLKQAEDVRAFSENNTETAHKIKLALLNQSYSLKNLFLRGHEPSAYYLHLEEFFNSERHVYDLLEQFNHRITDVNLLNQLKDLRSLMHSSSRDYRAAIDAYNEAKSNAHIAADKYTSIEELIYSDLATFETAIHNHEKKSLTTLREEQENALYLMLTVTVSGGLLVLVLLITFMRRRFLKPLENAVRTASAIAKGKKDLRIETPKDPADRKEFDVFALAFNNMLDSMEQKNKELEQAMSQLAASEKLSSLGSLVAGVSHELNTPIGVALTGSSCLGDRTEEVQKAMDDGTITKQQLTTYLDEVRIGSTLIVDNIHIASELIHNFKQVAVDQSSERRRRFNLKTSVEEILSTLTPTLKKTLHEVLIDIPDNIYMDSYPGPLGQVITNLINNSITHGFEYKDSGTIEIRASSDDTEVCIQYRDNGKGMTKDVKKHIFDPFFTTKMGQGGSGLGMHIVHNIVHGILKGRLSLHSSPNKGVDINIELPLQTDDRPSL
jgi:signal transduction histidine kinase